MFPIDAEWRLSFSRDVSFELNFKKITHFKNAITNEKLMQ